MVECAVVRGVLRPAVAEREKLRAERQRRRDGVDELREMRHVPTETAAVVGADMVRKTESGTPLPGCELGV